MDGKIRFCSGGQCDGETTLQAGVLQIHTLRREDPTFPTRQDHAQLPGTASSDLVRQLMAYGIDAKFPDVGTELGLSHPSHAYVSFERGSSSLPSDIGLPTGHFGRQDWSHDGNTSQIAAF